MINFDSWIQEAIKEDKVKRLKEMPFKARVFNTKEDKDFWNPYQISKSDLQLDNVFPIIWYKIYSKRSSKIDLIENNIGVFSIMSGSNKIDIAGISIPNPKTSKIMRKPTCTVSDRKNWRAKHANDLCIMLASSPPPPLEGGPEIARAASRARAGARPSRN